MDATNSRDIWVHCDKLYTPFRQVNHARIQLREGKIARVLDAAEAPDLPPGQVLHEPGALVAPGFIDLHIHGAGGRDLMDGSLESLRTVSGTLARHGTTAFLATTLSAPDSDTERALRGFAANRAAVNGGAIPLGIHMEGPYLNPARRGTHNSGYLIQASVPSFQRFMEVSENTVLRITVAPEMDPHFDLIREAVRRGVRVSLGHSDATEETAKAAADAGASQTTHTFNAMRPLHQREPGILGFALSDDRICAEVIADGIHVHWTNVKMLVRMKGIERIILVTDGLSSVDMPDGNYPLGDKIITVKDGHCRDQDGTLAGSTLTLDRAVQNLVRKLNLPLEWALAAASACPARSMGLADGKGVIGPGADADLVFLDSDFNVIRTMVGGRTVFRKS